MDFTLTEEQEQLRALARTWVEREVMPYATEWDRAEQVDPGIIKRLGDVGFLGLGIAEEYGGSGGDMLAYCLVMEELGRGDSSVRGIVSVSLGLVAKSIQRWGTEEQKHRWLPGLCAGELLGCFGLTEPDAGSDAAAQKTTAVRDGDFYVINGAKNWITNGTRADAIVLFAMTNKEAGHRGISAFIVDLNTPGVTRAPADRKLGINASESCSLYFENVRVPAKNLLGKEGEGFKVAMSTLDGGRIGIAAQAVGIARAAYEAALAYAKQRKSFGKPIAEHQAIAFMLADMATDIDAARLLVLRAAALKDQGVRHTAESSMAKLYASEMSHRVTHKALQIHGGYGYSKEFDVERYYRDSRITEIYEGTSEIQRIVISANLLKA